MKEAFFEISQKDLEASKLLFKNKLYPQAVFYLQQSVEKATKSFGILDNIITLKEAKQVIGHDSLKIYKKILDGLLKDMKDFEKIVHGHFQLSKTKIVGKMFFKFNSKTISKYLNSLTNIDELRAYSFSLTKDVGSLVKFLNELAELELDNLVKFLNELGELELNRPSLPSIPTEQELKEFKKDMEELLNVFSKLNSEIVNQVKNRVNKLLDPDSKGEILGIGKFLMDLFYIPFSLFLLSYLLPCFHAVNTRYPDEKGQNPREIYNEKHPLIQFYDDLVKIMEKTLSKMGNLFFKEANRERVK